MSGSPRRFANQGLVYLSEIQTLEDVNELSVKQAKDILAMNRVNFKGVVEKDELLKHVGRLWRQEKQAQDGKIFTFYQIEQEQRCLFQDRENSKYLASLASI